MRRSTLIFWIVVAILAVAGAYYASPYWTVRQLREAAEARDADRMSDFVDFPSLRESIKAELQASVVMPMLNDPKMKDNPFAGLGAMLAGAMLGPMIDSMISPAGLAAMLKQGPPSKPSEVMSKPPAVDGAAPARGAVDEAVRSTYSGLNRFVVAYARPDEPIDRAPALIFRRDGLFSWKLSKVRLPTPGQP